MATWFETREDALLSMRVIILPPAKRWGGVGGGGSLRRNRCFSERRTTPPPRPLPATRDARGGRGIHDLMSRPQRGRLEG
jgi:hypothetical protein